MVFSRTQANEIISGFDRAINESFALYRKNSHIDFTGKTFDETFELVQSVTTSYKSLISSVMYDGYFMPKCIINFEVTRKGNEDVADSIILTVRTSLKAKMKFVHKVKLAVADYVDTSAVEIKNACLHMLLLEIVDSNLIALNDKIKSICDEAGAGVSFGFALSNNYIVDIDDNIVIFGTSTETALDVSTLTIMRTIEDTDMFSDYDKIILERDTERIISAVKGKTTPQIIKANLDIVKTMTGVQTKKRADRLMRLTYHKQAKYFDTLKKGGIGYVDKTVNIDGTEVDIFALLEKSADGVVSVKLSPFNIKTTFNVDYDVLNNYKD